MSGLPPANATHFEIDHCIPAITAGMRPDRGVCPGCLAELFDPTNRRHRYVFIDCVDCGPGYAVTRRAPANRADTSFAEFEPCPACEREARSPRGRRAGHALISCPDCGPQLWLAHADGWRLASEDPLRDAAAALARGEIVALKSVGGFELWVDARNPRAVERLRVRVKKDSQPFALRVANLGSAGRWVDLDDAANMALASPQRPLLVLPKRPGADELLRAVAPKLGELGIGLPATPLQYLLFHESAQRPQGLAWLSQPQVWAFACTSANLPGEPPVRDNRDAFERLRGVADLFVLNDLDIAAPSEPSVLKPLHDARQRRARAPGFRILRRGSGLVPEPVHLGRGGACVLAFGGASAVSPALLHKDQVFLGPPVSSALERPLGRSALLLAAERLIAHTGATPESVVHDLHTDLPSSRAAAEFASAHGLPVATVQQHHAAAAAVMAEHDLDRPLLALVLDGSRNGYDGRAWGGELLRLEGTACERLGHLRALPLPGADRAALEPWRLAASALHAMGREADIARIFSGQRAAAGLGGMLGRVAVAPGTSMALERWFDAAAALLHLCESAGFEGQAAAVLEAHAARGSAGLPAGGVDASGPVLDLLPLLVPLEVEPDPVRGAARFHAGVASALDLWVAGRARKLQITRVVVAGRSLASAVLSRALRARLQTRGLEVFEPSQLPTDEAALAVGQGLIARRLRAQ